MLKGKIFYNNALVAENVNIVSLTVIKPTGEWHGELSFDSIKIAIDGCIHDSSGIFGLGVYTLKLNDGREGNMFFANSNEFIGTGPLEQK